MYRSSPSPTTLCQVLIRQRPGTIYLVLPTTFNTVGLKVPGALKDESAKVAPGTIATANGPGLQSRIQGYNLPSTWITSSPSPGSVSWLAVTNLITSRH